MEETDNRPARAWRGPSAEQVRTIAENVSFASFFAPPALDPWGQVPLMTLDQIWQVLRPETEGARSPVENRALSAYLRHMTSRGKRNGRTAYRVRPLRPYETPAESWTVDDPLTRRLAEVVVISPSLPIRHWTSTRDIYGAVAPGVTLAHADKWAIGSWLSQHGARSARRKGNTACFWSVTLRGQTPVETG